MHKPVLLNEVIEYLNLNSESNFIDATISSGGHTEAVLENFPGLKVLGVEYDPDIYKQLDSKFKDNLILVNDSYVNLKSIVEKNNFRPDGILFDLGVSSWHYEKSGRGFSFMKDEILDMRFNPERDKTTAADIINKFDRIRLAELIEKFGEEKFAKQIAKNIVEFRKAKPIIKTQELVKVIENSVPDWYRNKKIHFATKTFQALRVAVNDELKNIEKGIQTAIDVLQSKGRLVVISFQGMEDKIVKNIFRDNYKKGIINLITKKTVKPTREEIRINPRSRSAKMKVVEKK